MQKRRRRIKRRRRKIKRRRRIKRKKRKTKRKRKTKKKRRIKRKRRIKSMRGKERKRERVQILAIVNRNKTVQPIRSLAFSEVAANLHHSFNCHLSILFDCYYTVVFIFDL